MSYTPPAPTAISLGFTSGSYTAPGFNALTFNFQIGSTTLDAVTVAADSVVTGDLDRTGAALAGNVSADVVLTGDPTTTIALDGIADVDSLADGAVTTSIELTGTASVDVAVTADVDTAITAAADVISDASASADLDTGIAISGDVVAESDITGDLRSPATLEGSAVSDSEVVADLPNTTPYLIPSATNLNFNFVSLAYSAPYFNLVNFTFTSSVTPPYVDALAFADSSATGTLDATGAALAADVVVDSTASADVVTQVTLAGDVVADSTVAGDAQVPVALAGDAVTDSSVTAVFEQNLDGAVVSDSVADGVLDVVTALSGSSTSESTAQGDVTTQVSVSGDASSYSSVDGAVGYPALLDGVAAGDSTVVGDLTTKIPLSGSVATDSTASGILSDSILGSAVAGSSASGDLSDSILGEVATVDTVVTGELSDGTPGVDAPPIVLPGHEIGFFEEATNLRITIDLSGYAVDYSTYQSTGSEQTIWGTRTPSPVVATRSIGGYEAPNLFLGDYHRFGPETTGFFADFYGKVYVNPEVLDPFGFVFDEPIAFEVWNSHSTPVTITSIVSNHPDQIGIEVVPSVKNKVNTLDPGPWISGSAVADSFASGTEANLTISTIDPGGSYVSGLASSDSTADGVLSIPASLQGSALVESQMVGGFGPVHYTNTVMFNFTLLDEYTPPSALDIYIGFGSISGKAVSGSSAVAELQDKYIRPDVVQASSSLEGALDTVIDLRGSAVSDSVTVAAMQVQQALQGSATSDSFVTAELSTGIVLPPVINPTESRTINLYAKNPSQVRFDVTVTVTIAETNERVKVRLLGDRPRVLIAPPAYNTPVKETIQWLTDVKESYNGTEQRVQLRGNARVSMEYQTEMTAVSRQYLTNFMFGARGESFISPLWLDEFHLASNAIYGSKKVNIDFHETPPVAGDMLIFHQSAYKYQVVRVVSYQQTVVELEQPLHRDLPKGTRVLFAQAMRFMDKQEFNGITEMFSESTLTLETVDGVRYFGSQDLTGETTYRSLPVLDHPLNWAGNISHKISHHTNTVDNGTSSYIHKEKTGRSYGRQGYREFLNSHDKATNFRRWLYARRGAVDMFWTPTDSCDFRVVQDITGGSTSVTVDSNGYSEYRATNTGHRDILIRLANGKSYFRRIVSSTVVGDGTEILTLDASLSSALVKASAVKMVSLLILSRIDTDSVEILHERYHFATSEFNVKGLTYDV